MGQAQVIYQQQDPTAAMLQQTGESIRDTIQKSQALKLTGQYYKILAKNAQTEEDKFKFDRLAKLNSDILPQIASTKDPAMKAMLIKGVVDSGMYGGDQNQFLHDMHESSEHVAGNHANVAGNNPAPNPQAQPDAVSSQLGAMQAPAGGFATPGQVGGAQTDELRARALADIVSAHSQGLAQKYTALENSRTPWQKLVGNHTPEMKTLEGQMVGELPVPGAQEAQAQFPEGSPANTFVSSQSSTTNNNAYKVGTLKQKNGKWYRKASDGYWDEVNNP